MLAGSDAKRIVRAALAPVQPAVATAQRPTNSDPREMAAAILPPDEKKAGERREGEGEREREEERDGCTTRDRPL